MTSPSSSTAGIVKDADGPFGFAAALHVVWISRGRLPTWGGVGSHGDAPGQS